MPEWLGLRLGHTAADLKTMENIKNGGNRKGQDFGGKPKVKVSVGYMSSQAAAMRNLSKSVWVRFRD